MGILISGLPNAIEINEKTYEIDSDYRTCLKIIMAFEDSTLSVIEKSMILVDLLYREMPCDFQEAVKKGIKFLDCGEEEKAAKTVGDSRKYSFSHDEKYIFSGVDRVLNGRLSKGNYVHWWEFVMAFMELPEDCIMSRIIYFRTQKEKGKLTREEQKIYYENRNIFELPEELTADEEAAKDKFMELLGK